MIGISVQKYKEYQENSIDFDQIKKVVDASKSIVDSLKDENPDEKFVLYAESLLQDINFLVNSLKNDLKNIVIANAA